MQNLSAGGNLTQLISLSVTAHLEELVDEETEAHWTTSPRPRGRHVLQPEPEPRMCEPRKAHSPSLSASASHLQSTRVPNSGDRTISQMNRSWLDSGHHDS